MIKTRRDFLMGAGALALCPWSLPCIAGSEGRSYSVPILGDIHFDSSDTKTYHADYTRSTSESRYKAHCAEHVRNARMWKERMPRLVRASAGCVRQDAAFALQMGDLVQGDCGNAATHERMLNDAFAFVKSAYGGKLPLVVVAGNHDIRGDLEEDGARMSLEKWLPRTMARELEIPVMGTTFSFRHGPDVFIIVDFNEPMPDFKLLKRLLRESSDARYMFLVSHGPAIPCGDSRWFLLGNKKRDGQRRELRSLLARRNAICLGGHTHKLEFYDCEFMDGHISQFVFNSVWSRPGLENTATGGRADKYGCGEKCIVDLVAEYRPYVKDVFLANTAGHYRLEVSDGGVAVVFYAGDSTTPTRTFTLR